MVSQRLAVREEDELPIKNGSGQMKDDHAVLPQTKHHLHVAIQALAVIAHTLFNGRIHAIERMVIDENSRPLVL